jgi:hypothetical protein
MCYPQHSAHVVIVHRCAREGRWPGQSAKHVRVLHLVLSLLPSGRLSFVLATVCSPISIHRASPLVFRCDLGWIRRTNASPPCERRSGPGCSDEVATRRQRTRWLPRIKDPILHHCPSLKAVPVTQLAFLGVASLLYSGLPSLPRSVRPIARFFHLNHGGRGTARTSFRQCTRS